MDLETEQKEKSREEKRGSGVAAAGRVHVTAGVTAVGVGSDTNSLPAHKLVFSVFFLPDLLARFLPPWRTRAQGAFTVTWPTQVSRCGRAEAASTRGPDSGAGGGGARNRRSSHARSITELILSFGESTRTHADTRTRGGAVMDEVLLLLCLNSEMIHGTNPR